MARKRYTVEQIITKLREAEEFAGLKAKARLETPTLDSLLARVPRSAGRHRQEAVS